MSKRAYLGTVCVIGFVILRTAATTHVIIGKADSMSKNERTNLTSSIKSFQIKQSTLENNTQENGSDSDSVAAEAKQHKINSNKVVNEIVDGRSSFVNNEYILDDEALLDDSPPPLYELLQQQMEQILASTRPGTPIYRTDNNSFNPMYANDISKEYSENAMEQEEAAAASYSSAQSATMQEVPKPIASSNLKADIKTSTEYQERLESTYARPSPALIANKPLQHPVISNSMFVNGNIHKRKRRISFKTVSTATHIVSTPIADLLFKFSIGIAKPTAAVKDADIQ